MRVKRDFIYDPGLVLYLPLYELDGVSFVSKDARGHLCTVIGAFWTPQGRTFDVDDLINLDNVVPALSATTVGIWMFWVKFPDVTPATSMTLLSFSDTNALEIVYCYLQTTGKLVFDCYDAGVHTWALTTDAAAPLTDNRFHFLVFIQDGVSPYLLVDGVQLAVTFSNVVDKTRWFSGLAGVDNGRIGTQNVANVGEANYTTGTFGELLIYNRVLSALELERIRLATKWRYQ